MSFDLQSVWNQLYESGNMPEAKRTAFLDDLLVLLEKELATTLPNADLLYAIGYLCYVHPDKSEEMQKKLLTSLLSAMELDPTFGSPVLQMGHYYYDKADYATALTYFEKAASFNWDDYYAVFIEEMILCCVLFLNGLEIAKPKLEIFVTKCLSVDELDVFPNQLFNCMMKVFPRSQDLDVKERVMGLLEKLVRCIGQETVFGDKIVILRNSISI